MLEETAFTAASASPAAQLLEDAMSEFVETDETAQGEDVPTFEFELDFQKKVLALFMRDPQFAMKSRDLLKPEYFTNDADKIIAKIVLDYVQKFKAAPGNRLFVDLLKDAIKDKKVRPDMVEEVKDATKVALRTDLTGSDYVLEKVVTFAKHQALIQAMAASVDALMKGDFETISKKMTSALAVGTILDRGEYDFWDEIDNRTQERDDFNNGRIVTNGITTGLPALDNHLFHCGWGRRELSLVMAPAKGGKSALLVQFGMSASLHGHNVIHFTLENSAKITANRLDASTTDTIIRELNKNAFDVAAKLKAMRKQAGHYKIREYATGTLRPSEIRRVLEDYRAKGIIFDLIVVDYADIMMPERWTDNTVENSKSIYVDLRAVGFDYDAAILTATQTNREGAKAVTSKATDVAEDFNRIRIADEVIAINATEGEKQTNQARITFVASRNTEDGVTFQVESDRQRMKFIKKIIGRV